MRLADELYDYAKHYFWLLGYDKGSKANRLDTLNQVWKQTKKRPAKLDGPKMPTQLSYLWNDFITLKNANAAQSISYQELDAFCRLTEIDLKCWETDILINLDLIYRRAFNDGR